MNKSQGVQTIQFSYSRQSGLAGNALLIILLLFHLLHISFNVTASVALRIRVELFT